MVRANAALTKAWMVLRTACAAGQLAVRDAGIRQVAADAAEEAGIGAAEAIDGLLGVAHHVELARRRRGFAPVALGRIGGGQQQQNLGLQRVGVLELVHEDALVILLQLGARAVVAQQVARVQEQVHEVELPGQLLLLLIEAHDLPQLVAQVRRQVGVGVAAELLDGGLQLLPRGHHRFPRNGVAVFAAAGFEPPQVARQTEKLVLRQVGVEAAGVEGQLYALQEFGQGTQAVVEDVAGARAAIAQLERALRLEQESLQAGRAVEAALCPRGR